MISKKLKLKTKTRHSYNTRSNRSANFDRNRVEGLPALRTKTPKRTGQTSAQKKSFTVYPLTSRPLLEMEDQNDEQIHDGQLGAGATGQIADDNRSVSDILLGFTDSERQRDEVFSHFRERLSTGTLPKQPPKNNELNIRKEIERTVQKAVRQSQTEILSQLQASITQSLQAGFQQMAINVEKRYMAEPPPVQIPQIPNLTNTRRAQERDQGFQFPSSSPNSAAPHNISLDSQGNRKIKLEDWGFIFEGRMDGT